MVGGFIEEQYFSRIGLAETLGVSPRTLDRWAFEGEGPARTKVGRKVLYKKEDVEKWLEKSKA